MNIQDMIDAAEHLANIAAKVIPGASIVGDVAKIGGGILDVLDGLKDDAQPSQQADMQAARAKLAEAVKAKAAEVSKSLRG